MRVLVTTAAVPARLYNLVPLGWALRTTGHELCVASLPGLAPVTKRSGLTAVETGGEPVSAPVNDHMLADLVEFAKVWRPDLVVWDADTFEGPLAATSLGVPHVRVLSTPDNAGPRWQQSREHPFADRLGEFVLGHATVDPTPACFRFPVDVGYRPVRYVPYDGVAVYPAWLQKKPRRPRVAVALERPSASTAVFAALANLDVDVIATLDTRRIPPEARIADNIRLLDHLSLNVLLPGCSAVVHDGDMKAISTAVVHGVPQLGMAGDMTEIEKCGAGLAADAESLPGQVARLLADESIKDGAAALRAEMLGRPSPQDIVPELVGLA
ncbi:nucleotide disphospho-sugar-binding domain-containing protein [Kibdelosporangium persicum]|uniref:Glycosyltransferase DesVII n=1 Tax=Kibdelosporangium persicum TaxID=2698649 RepID=A0ABX2F5F6_9PSEU|nr:nucleotide disphospho-sugar-binding domain-containing protein [Kibdelosporangium persicum]NRN66574.1 Glycosyltransferase DesVII [Kibdelosporangium persicum]